jgi:hypothetical protein
MYPVLFRVATFEVTSFGVLRPFCLAATFRADATGEQFSPP